MSDFRAQIAGVLGALVVRPPSGFSWFGRESSRLRPAVASAISPRDVRTFLRTAVQFHLYSNFYLPGSASPSSGTGTGVGAGSVETSFVETLSRSNAGKRWGQAGWRVRSVDDDGVVAHRDGLDVRVPLAVATGGVDSLRPGDELTLQRSKERLNLSPGFYLAMSDQPMEPSVPGEIVRFYWNLAAEGAPRLMSLVTRAFNGSGVPFQMKVLADPNGYSRCDAGTLYLLRSDVPGVADELRRIHRAVAPFLKPDTPALTKVLARGLGLAESPTTGESFGLLVCRLLAEALVDAGGADRVPANEGLRAVIDRFSDDGRSIDAPFLNRGSRDYYSLGFPPSRARRPDASSQAGSPDRPVCLTSAAADCGRDLVRSAAWYRGRCNWIGVDESAGDRPGTRRALEAHLYNGTGGVAWFLANLYRATGDPGLHRTAVGAIGHSLDRVEALLGDDRTGLYDGALGVALASVHVGTVLGESGIVEAGLETAERSGSVSDRSGWDLLSGAAGVVIALLCLWRSLGDTSCLERASRAGEALLANARHLDGGYAWTTGASRRPLTGLSHGSAGPGLALTELFAATRDDRFRAGAEKAFGYEAQWFDDDACNWLDLRDTGRGAVPRSLVRSATTWCHGAPGIALSRLRAFEVLGDTRYRDEAAVALDATRRWLTDAEVTASTDLSLCHGVAGNAEILLTGARLMRHQQAEEDLGTVTARARSIAEERPRTRSAAGTGLCGANPAAMLGLAGTGNFLLRLTVPATPSLLLFRPDGE